MNRRRLLKRLEGKMVSVFSDYTCIMHGKLHYEGRVFVNELQVPICAMRNVAPWHYGDSDALIFVDPAYRLEERKQNGYRT